jgi:cyclophilin family peptidyl-prolyl cis-trans isomerase
MIRRFWFASVSGAVIVTTVALISGCKKQEGMVSEEQSKKEVLSKEPKEIGVDSKKVKLETSMGDIVIELDEEKAPVTVKNFLQYMEDGFYDGTIFHRVIPNFMIQGGGFTSDMQRKATQPAIVNEAANGLKNDRGTIAMARTNDPDSATSQFFINHRDNGSLNYAGPGNPGYAVFGRVVEGMDVVDKIAAVKTTRRGPYSDVPVEPVVIKSAKLVPSSKSD